MHFTPEVYSSEFPALLTRFISITSWSVWKKRIETIDRNIADNPLQSEFYTERHALELELSRTLATKRRTGQVYDKISSHQQFKFYSFVAMFARVHQRLENGAKFRLERNLFGALKGDNTLHYIQHELDSVAHLMSQGFDVTFNDLENEGGFDFLAERDGKEIEFECKTISADIGRKIHKKRLVQLGSRLAPMVSQFLDASHGGYLIKITVPKRLYGTSEFQNSIVEAVERSLTRSENKFDGPEPCEVTVREFDLNETPFLLEPTEGIARDEMELAFERLGLKPDPQAILAYRPGKVATVIVVESREKDEVLASVMEQAKKAADQFSTQRPAVISIRLLDLSPPQIRSLGDGLDDPSKPSGLRIVSSAFLSDERRRHVHTIAFDGVADISLARHRRPSSDIIETTWSGTGPAYVLKNPFHPQRDDPAYSVFSV